MSSLCPGILMSTRDGRLLHWAILPAGDESNARAKCALHKFNGFSDLRRLLVNCPQSYGQILWITCRPVRPAGFAAAGWDC